jgi:hypothetical protein
MNAPERFFLPDVQSSPDIRQLAIHQVGVRGLRYPLALMGADGQARHTVATLSMSVGLPPEVKGTHMSRFVEVLEAKRAPMSLMGMQLMLAEMLARLDAASGRIEMAFPWFIIKTAPVSGVESLLDYDVRVVLEKRVGRDAETRLEIVAPVTSLCPCSKKISDYGAHNQRSHITLSATLRGDMSLRSWCASPKRRPPARSSACSSAPTRSGSPSAPTTTPSSSRTWCATSPCACAPTAHRRVVGGSRKTSSPSTTIPPTPAATPTRSM